MHNQLRFNLCIDLQWDNNLYLGNLPEEWSVGEIKAKMIDFVK